MNELPPIKVDLVKPITALVEKVAEGIGGLFAPFQIVRLAKADAKASEIKANADALVSKIQTETNIELQEYQRRAMNRLVAEETRKQINIESITTKAIEDLKEDAKPENIDNDWIANFFDKCKLISDEDMQNIWGRVLAGEANNPGKFSKRTIDFLASMDKEDAELFENLSYYRWFIEGRKQILIYDETDEIYTKNKINFSALKHLSSIGLINFSSTYFGLKLINQDAYSSYYSSPVILNINSTNTDNLINIGKVLITKMGEELLSIVENEPLPEFFDYILKKWYSQGLLLHSYFPKFECQMDMLTYVIYANKD